MPLLALWAADPDAVTQLTIEQVVATAGDGKLRDESDAARELRRYLSQVTTDRLAAYAEHCLATPFAMGGLVLQDLVNELGRRLEYDVTNGRYRGTPNAIGHDGVWVSPEGPAVVVEVKTSDAYRIALGTIAGYRDRLEAAGAVPRPASVLIVVGREDTGELEAQVRGSRHAWDTRLISVDALLALVRVKESTDVGPTGAKIRSVLAPVEYTRLDALVDAVFAVTQDVEAAAAGEKRADDAAAEGVPEWETPTAVAIQETRDAAIRALEHRDGKRLVKCSRATYWDADHRYRVACTVSKRYGRKGVAYWYSYRPYWDEFLGGGDAGWLVLGCVGLGEAYALPLALLRQHLPHLHTTTTPEGRRYWHIRLAELAPGSIALQLPHAGPVPLSPYRLAFPAQPGAARTQLEPLSPRARAAGVPNVAPGRPPNGKPRP